MAQQAGIPASTLRYYDKEGLLPFVERAPAGIRIFQDRDMEWLRVIGCLKRAGMPLEDIRRYIQLAMEGDGTIGERLELFRKQRELLRPGWRSFRPLWTCWSTNAGTTRPPRPPELWRFPRAWLRSRCRNLSGRLAGNSGMCRGND